MIYKSQGKIKQMTQVESGVSKTGFEWANMTVVLAVPAAAGTYFDEAFRVRKDDIVKVQEFKVGDEVSVSWALSCREWNGRWFTDAQILDIFPAKARLPWEEGEQGTAPSEENEDLPF